MTGLLSSLRSRRVGAVAVALVAVVLWLDRDREIGDALLDAMDEPLIWIPIAVLVTVTVGVHVADKVTNGLQPLEQSRVVNQWIEDTEVTVDSACSSAVRRGCAVSALCAFSSRDVRWAWELADRWVLLWPKLLASTENSTTFTASDRCGDVGEWLMDAASPIAGEVGDPVDVSTQAMGIDRATSLAEPASTSSTSAGSSTDQTTPG